MCEILLYEPSRKLDQLKHPIIIIKTWKLEITRRPITSSFFWFKTASDIAIHLYEIYSNIETSNLKAVNSGQIAEFIQTHELRLTTS